MYLAIYLDFEISELNIFELRKLVRTLCVRGTFLESFLFIVPLFGLVKGEARVSCADSRSRLSSS